MLSCQGLQTRLNTTARTDIHPLRNAYFQGLLTSESARLLIEALAGQLKEFDAETLQCCYFAMNFQPLYIASIHSASCDEVMSCSMNRRATTAPGGKCIVFDPIPQLQNQVFQAIDSAFFFLVPGSIHATDLKRMRFNPRQASGFWDWQGEETLILHTTLGTLVMGCECRPDDRGTHRRKLLNQAARTMARLFPDDTVLQESASHLVRLRSRRLTTSSA